MYNAALELSHMYPLYHGDSAFENRTTEILISFSEFSCLNLCLNYRTYQILTISKDIACKANLFRNEMTYSEYRFRIGLHIRTFDIDCHSHQNDKVDRNFETKKCHRLL